MESTLKSINVMYVFSTEFDVSDLAKTKSDVSDNLCGLKEFFVLPTTKLFAGSHNKRMNFNQGMLCAMRYISMPMIHESVL
jgi:hypothetical protein